jgi:uncharacterized coiled-coil protein SlyX
MMEARTVSELSERINRLEARVTEDRQVIEAQQEAILFQRAVLRELSEAYEVFESTVIEMADESSGRSPRKPRLRLVH